MTYNTPEVNLEIEKIPSGLDNPDLPLLIAGPCSAESEEQVMDVARQLKATKRISIFRAGVWKPRTRPNMFEGVGKVALEWLQNVKTETGLRVATEVATTEHVEQALKYGIDVLWVGTRTATNPFSIQAIADALAGTNATVLVKNPLSPDVQLWIGALERINRAGIKQLAAIHRGFASIEKTIFRNAPMWNIPIELKAACPNLPIICDPSHICGNTELIPMVAQKALDMDMDGLMIECHNKPECALSDAKQQLTPVQYQQLITSLILRKPTLNQSVDNVLNVLRKEIDEFDDEMIHKLALRMKTVEKIGEYKLENDITILQMNRWKDILEQRITQGELMGLNKSFLKQFLELIHQESINIQTNIMNKKNED